MSLVTGVFFLDWVAGLRGCCGCQGWGVVYGEVMAARDEGVVYGEVVAARDEGVV